MKDEKVIQIEGDSDSPVSRGRLCPKGAASLQMTTGDSRQHQVLYRRPHGTDWEPLDLETAEIDRTPAQVAEAANPPGGPKAPTGRRHAARRRSNPTARECGEGVRA